MKPPPFLYAAPDSVEETLALLAEYGADAKLLAGGQSLMPLLNMRLARPAVLVDLNRVKGLEHITASNGEIRVGAMTRQRVAERSSVLASRVPLITEALRWVGHAQIRNRGTVGGSLAHADPAAELPAVAAVLGATFAIAGPNGTRTRSSDEFFVGYLTTAIEPAEVLTEVRFPVMPRDAGWAFTEISRRHGDFALVGVAALIHINGVQCHNVRLAFTGVGPTPVRVLEAEAALEGQRLTRGAGAGQQGWSLDDALLREVGRLVAERIEPESDIQASAEYRKHIAGVLARRAVTAAAARAGGATE